MTSFNPYTKVLVTGGTGFVGRNVVHQMLNWIAPASLFMTYHNNDDIRNKMVQRDEIYGDNTYKVDFSSLGESRDAFLPLFRDVHTVIHCAAFTGGATVIHSGKNDIVSRNAVIDMNVIRNAAEAGVKRFVYISSSAIYPSSPLSLTETQGFDGDPDGIFYGIGWMKRFGEKMVSYYSMETGMQGLIIRPSNIFGPYDHFSDKGHVIPGMMYRMHEAKLRGDKDFVVWGTPNVVRDFIFASSFTSNMISLLLSVSTTDVFNVSTGVDVSMGELADTMKKVVEFEGNIVFDTSRPVTKKVQRVSPAKLLQVQNGRYGGFPLEEALRRTYSWYTQSLVSQA